MAGPTKEYYDYLDTLNPYGGNEGSYYDYENKRKSDEGAAAWDDSGGSNAGARRWYARQNLGLSPEESERFARGESGGPGVEKSVNEWADTGRGVLGLSRGSSANIDAARQQVLSGRQQQLDLLGLIRNGRGDAVTAQRVASGDDLLRQAAMARSAGVAPGLALTASADSGRDMAKQAMAARTQQAAGQSAALNEGAYAVRGSDLSRAAIEQQTLDGDLAFQQAKEDLYLQHIGQGMRQAAGARGAELRMADIVASSPDNGISFSDNVLPGLTQMASLGLMGIARGQGSANGWSTAGGYPRYTGDDL